MHFEILVEDLSGQRALEALVPKIVGEGHTIRIHAYKGIGRIPKGLKPAADPSKRILLDNLPRLLSGYGRAYREWAKGSVVVLVICDLDDRAQAPFMSELSSTLDQCHPKPEAMFFFAIEEGEAWLLGDLPAIRSTYPGAKASVLGTYVNDAICGTWELLADALHPGGAKALSAKGWQAVGAEKSIWAERICPNMEIDRNLSPSFQEFRDALRMLSRSTTSV